MITIWIIMALVSTSWNHELKPKEPTAIVLQDQNSDGIKITDKASY